MKPRIIKSSYLWSCHGGKWCSFGYTPTEAYALCRNLRRMGRLNGISAVRARKRMVDMKAAARQQRIKDAQRKPAEVVAVKPVPTLFEWLRGILLTGAAR